MTGSNDGFRLQSPFARSREKPRLPVELIGMADEDYAQRLREFGYSEHAIVEELERLKVYMAKMQPQDATPAVKPGPTKGTLFNDWTRALRKRGARKELSDDETE